MIFAGQSRKADLGGTQNEGALARLELSAYQGPEQHEERRRFTRLGPER